MKRFFLLCAAVVIACASCAAEDPVITTAKERISRQLRDPASVQFRNVERHPKGAVCGEYNAKNGYGAYVGFKPFGYTSKGDVIDPLGYTTKGGTIATEQFFTRCKTAT